MVVRWKIQGSIEIIELLQEYKPIRLPQIIRHPRLQDSFWLLLFLVNWWKCFLQGNCWQAAQLQWWIVSLIIYHIYSNIKFLYFWKASHISRFELESPLLGLHTSRLSASPLDAWRSLPSQDCRSTTLCSSWSRSCSDRSALPPCSNISRSSSEWSGSFVWTPTCGQFWWRR